MSIIHFRFPPKKRRRKKQNEWKEIPNSIANWHIQYSNICICIGMLCISKAKLQDTANVNGSKKQKLRIESMNWLCERQWKFPFQPLLAYSLFELKMRRLRDQYMYVWVRVCRMETNKIMVCMTDTCLLSIYNRADNMLFFLYFMSGIYGIALSETQEKRHYSVLSFKWLDCYIDNTRPYLK